MTLHQIQFIRLLLGIELLMGFTSVTIAEESPAGYSITNKLEYFAECTEAFFGENDFYPFNKKELADHDPLMYRVLTQIWAEKKK